VSPLGPLSCTERADEFVVTCQARARREPLSNIAIDPSKIFTELLEHLEYVLDDRPSS
jgi:hypothetical protein